jgi:hypothetical protein
VTNWDADGLIMITVEALNCLLQHEIANPREEPLFFRALLDAMVYVRREPNASQEI